MPVGATPTASQEAADGGASSRRRRRRRRAKWEKKCDANSTSARRIFQRRQPVAFEHFAPGSMAKVGNSIQDGRKRIRRLEDSKGKQQQSVRPRWSELGNRWVEKKSTVFFSSSGAAPHRTQHASRETAQHPASFRRFQPSRQAIETKVASIPGNDSARQRQMPPPRKPKIKEERHDPDL